MSDSPLGYEALRAGRAFVRLGDWSALAVEGSDALKHVNSFATNDIAKLASGEACEAFFCDVKAHVLAYTLVARQADRLVVLLNSVGALDLANHLDRYVIREDVGLRPLGDEQALLLVPREAWSAELAQAGEAIPLDLLGPAYFAAVVLRRSLPGIEEHLTDAGYTSASTEALEVLRIEQGWPRDRQDVDARNLPQEVRRDRQAISFTKGCYLGQEPVARIDALGHVNQGLVGLRCAGDTIPALGAEVSADDKGVGRVTSGCWSPQLAAPLVLAYVRRAHTTPGTPLAVAGTPAIVTPLPVTAS